MGIIDTYRPAHLKPYHNLNQSRHNNATTKQWMATVTAAAASAEHRDKCHPDKIFTVLKGSLFNIKISASGSATNIRWMFLFM